MKRREKGFTMLELLLVIAITGAIIAPLTMATISLLTNPQRTVDQGIVLQQVQNSGYWVSRDVQMARYVTPGATNGFPLTLDIPVDTDENNDYSIDYLFDASKLKRQVYDALHILVSETLIADYIDTDNTSFTTVEPGVYKLTVKAVTDTAHITRSYEIKQRLSLDSEE